MIRRGTGALLVLLAAVATTAGCTSWSSSIEVKDADGHRILTYNRTPRGAGTAALDGPLALNVDSCLGVESGAGFQLVLFPNETRWISSKKISVNGQEFSIGDRIVFGGGINSSAEARDTVQRYCPASAASIWDTG